MNDEYIILYGDPKNKNNEGYAYILKENKHYKFVQFNSVDNEKHEIVLNNRDVVKVVEFLSRTI